MSRVVMLLVMLTRPVATGNGRGWAPTLLPARVGLGICRGSKGFGGEYRRVGVGSVI